MEARDFRKMSVMGCWGIFGLQGVLLLGVHRDLGIAGYFGNWKVYILLAESHIYLMKNSLPAFTKDLVMELSQPAFGSN